MLIDFKSFRLTRTCISIQIECLKTHHMCVSDIVSMTEGLTLTDQAPLTRCQELSEELENITVTITTIAEMNSKSSEYLLQY